MARILVTAEAYGFGPPSKAEVVCGELASAGVECHFVGEGISLAFARANASAFSSIEGVNAMSDLALIRPDGFDAAVSVMDPYLPVWAAVHRLPCFYVDSLFWLWQWPREEQDDLQKVALKLQSMPDVAEAMDCFASIPMHASQYVAHYLSDVILAQRSPTTVARTKDLPSFRRVEVVEAIVDLAQREETDRSHWLASMSGLLNPLIDPAMAADWVRVVITLIAEAARASHTEEPILLAGNPNVLGQITEPLPPQFRVTPLTHRDMLRTMNGAIGSLAPPGLTTMLECAAYGAPLILLPEQHYGHIANHKEVSRGDDTIFPQALLNTNLDRKVDSDVLQETRNLLDQLTRHSKLRDDVWQRMVAGIASGMTEAKRNPAALRVRQQAAVKQAVGGYSGAAQIKHVVQSVLDERRWQGHTAGR